MQRGSDKSSAQEWADPDPPADDDTDRSAQRREEDRARLERVQHDLSVANDAGTGGVPDDREP